jgi:hypothetical protein
MITGISGYVFWPVRFCLFIDFSFFQSFSAIE